MADDARSCEDVQPLIKATKDSVDPPGDQSQARQCLVDEYVNPSAKNRTDPKFTGAEDTLGAINDAAIRLDTSTLGAINEAAIRRSGQLEDATAAANFNRRAANAVGGALGPASLSLAVNFDRRAASA